MLFWHMMEKSAEDKGLWQQIKDTSLEKAGLGYIIGDAALFAHGVAHRDVGRAITGLSWGVGGVALAAFGKEPKEYQLKRLAYDLEDFFAKEGIDIPTATALHTDYKARKQWYDSIQKFCYDYPSEILNANYAFGASTLIWQGMKRHDPWEAASGVLVLGGALAGLLTKEDKSEVSVDDSFVEKIQKNPLAISGALYTLNNFTLARSAWGEQKANPANKTYLLKYLTVGVYVLANGLLGISSKDSAQVGADYPVDEIEALAAEVLAAQPEATRNQLIEAAAEHLAEYPNITDTKEGIAAKLKSRILEKPLLVTEGEHEGRVQQPEHERT